MNKNEKKHLIKLIEEYLQNEDDIIKKKKLQSIKDYHHKLGFTNSIVHERSIRKNLKILKEGLNQKTNKICLNKRNGLYHERFQTLDTFFNDEYDIFSMDCQDSPFCMHHRRYGEDNQNYKIHYCCKYNNKFYIGNGNERSIKWTSNKFVCFNCRKICKRYKNKQIYNIYDKWPKCSYCNKYMESVGVEFTPPPKNEKKHWEKLNKEWYKYSRMTYTEYELYCNYKQ